MAPKQQLPPPIDRPLSKAYLRSFVGWSTAYPPGQSEPNSLRLMENLWVDRNGALNIRPGLRHLTYKDTPGLDPINHDIPGVGLNMTVVGAPELFYMNDGSPAMLFAVREITGGPDFINPVGFRVLLLNDVNHMVHKLTDEEVGFLVPQTDQVLQFEAGTTHVEYLQINNRILALSDNGEPARMFFVGGQKIAKRLKAISVPDWSDAHKLTVIHPDAAWINARASTTRTNTVLNPSFEIGTRFWNRSPTTNWKTVLEAGIQGSRVLEVESAPARTNMEPSPLHNVDAGGYPGWIPGKGAPTLQAWQNYLRMQPTADGDFLAEGPSIVQSVKSNGRYRVALDYLATYEAQPIIVLESYAANGMPLGSRTLEIDVSTNFEARWISPPLSASTGAVTMRLFVGGKGEPSKSGVGFRNIVVCPDGESPNMFHGGSGANYFWTGTAGQSASVYHPPQDIWVKTQSYAIRSGATAASASIAARQTVGTGNQISVGLLVYTTSMINPTEERAAITPTPTAVLGSTWTRYTAVRDPLPPNVVSSVLQVSIYGAARGQKFQLGAGLMEPNAGGGAYFDGSTPSVAGSGVINEWAGVFTNLPHEGPSQQTKLTTIVNLTPETPTDKTLIAIAGENATTKENNNPYKIGFFYTFENEIGESAGSRITEVRIKRPWSNWIWETPNANGEPSGTYSPNAEMIADQLVCYLPPAVFNQAVLEGAIRWNLYAFAWSDQEPVPVVAQLVAQQDIQADQSAGAAPFPYDVAGWIQVTAARKATTDDTTLPTQENRTNSSIPPTHRNGIVAGDRLVLVGSPNQSATIAWSSSAPGRYTMFTPNRGGGQKTLTSGNLNLPFSVVLWQNPQSVDTLAILCSDDNGRSTSYYMSPATIQSGNTGAASVMGFEETTSTPGTIAPFGAEVLNNALYRPLDRSLMKSTASNYNINHKTQTDKIANMWLLLESKHNIMSAQMDNRLYYLVHNPQGELLMPGCRGNEIWIYDISAENGHWSRFLVQGSALKPITIGAQSYMAVSSTTGIFYLDEQLELDNYVDLYSYVREQFIPWMFETNTQGANKAHDAWAHLQQVGVSLGNFSGSMTYGIRGWSVNGKRVEVSKEVRDNELRPPVGQKWDIEDVLLVRRDMKEWYFHAASLPGLPSSGQLGVVQYRYTPVSVNVGYEFGSIETFEYGVDRGSDDAGYSRNGIPLPYLDYSRP